MSMSALFYFLLNFMETESKLHEAFMNVNVCFYHDHTDWAPAHSGSEEIDGLLVPLGKDSNLPTEPAQENWLVKPSIHISLIGLVDMFECNDILKLGISHIKCRQCPYMTIAYVKHQFK